MTDAPPTRAELRALYADSDRFAAETDDWLADRKAAREAQERENAEAEELERRAYQNERAAASAAETPFSEEEPEPSYDFSEAQFDCLATVIDELHQEFDARIERAQQRILNTVVRLVMPSEYAERELYL